MNERNDFVGEFKDLLSSFVKHKRALGYKYTTVRENLRRFSVFTLSYTVENKALSKEIVIDWTAKIKSESVKTWEHRASDLKQFALYLQDLGYKVYMPDKKLKVLRNQYIPYIFTHEELQRFFCACDCLYSNVNSIKHKVLPVVFRLLYCCGLRISEAVNLRVKDVDLDSGIITIRESKFNHDRLIPMDKSLTDIFIVYKKNINNTSNTENYFFINKNGTKLTENNVYKRFREILWKAGISHGGKGKDLVFMIFVILFVYTH